MKKIVLLFILISSYAFSQTVNDYQYVIVPSKFTIFSQNDKYRLNTLTKLVLQKYGFKAFLQTDEIPDEIANNNCKKLYADLISDNGFLNVKVKILLKDCKDKVVYETAFGKNNEKDLLTAYNLALREAAKSFDQLNYKYNGKNGNLSDNAVVEKHEENAEPKTNPDSMPIQAQSQGAFYFAQPIENGYQIVDTEPKVIMKLMNTSQKNVFIGIKGDINGTVILKNGQWFFEYYKNGSLVSESLNLKF